MSYLRSYARAMLIFQDLNQLEKTYSKARSMISNSSTQVAFGVNDFETADMLAKRIGKTTIETRSEGVSQSSSALLRHQAQAGQSEAGRWLIDPSVILRMNADEALVFMGRSVRALIRATRIRYSDDVRFAVQFDDWRGASPLALTFQPRFLTFQPRLLEHCPKADKENSSVSNVIPFPVQYRKKTDHKLSTTISAVSIRSR